MIDFVMKLRPILVAFRQSAFRAGLRRVTSFGWYATCMGMPPNAGDKTPMGRCYIQFSDRVLQSRLILRVSICDGHRHIDARRVRRRNRVTPDQGGLDEWLDSALETRAWPPKNLLHSALKE